MGRAIVLKKWPLSGCLVSYSFVCCDNLQVVRCVVKALHIISEVGDLLSLKYSRLSPLPFTEHTDEFDKYATVSCY